MYASVLPYKRVKKKSITADWQYHFYYMLYTQSLLIITSQPVSLPFHTK